MIIPNKIQFLIYIYRVVQKWSSILQGGSFVVIGPSYIVVPKMVFYISREFICGHRTFFYRIYCGQDDRSSGKQDTGSRISKDESI
jgi:hypothetical protein